MIYLANAFSIGMLDGADILVQVKEIDTDAVKEILQAGFESCIGHVGTAEVVGKLLSMPVEAQRRAIKLSKGDKLVVFQLLQRLPEGKILTEEELKNLPHKWFLVQIV